MHEYTLKPIGDPGAPAVWGEIVTLLAARAGSFAPGPLLGSGNPSNALELSDGATVVGVQVLLWGPELIVFRLPRTPLPGPELELTLITGRPGEEVTSRTPMAVFEHPTRLGANSRVA